MLGAASNTVPTAQFEVTRPGAVFRDGRLYRFSEHEVLVAAPWPPRAWRKTRDEPCWQGCRPHIGVGLLRLSLRHAPEHLGSPASGQLVQASNGVGERALSGWDRAALEFWLAIPRAARAIAARFTDRQWHVLSVLARCPGAEDVADSSPALLYALSSSWVFHWATAPMRAVRRLVRRPQREALEWLGFPGSESARRVLSRVVPRSAQVVRFLYLRGMLADEVAHRSLGHVPRINAGVLRVATDPALLARAAPRLLDEIGRDRRNDWTPHAAWLLADLVRMDEMLRGRPSTIRVRSLDSLAVRHEELIIRLARGSAVPAAWSVLPRPPVRPPGDGSIEPLDTVAAIFTEGRAQRNCVAGYVREVAEGRLYLYRVNVPERATLSLRRASAGERWRVQQLLVAKNRPVSARTRAAVDCWLEAEQAAMTATMPRWSPERWAAIEAAFERAMEAPYRTQDSWESGQGSEEELDEHRLVGQGADDRYWLPLQGGQH